MARARNIKPAFFQNEELAELSPLCRLAFIGMWTIADFKGCIELRPKRLKIQLLPYDNCNFEEIVSALEKSRFISTYSVQGQTYLKIINFEKHQTPHKNEKEAGSGIPDLPAQCFSNENLLKENKDLAEFGNKTEKIGTNTELIRTAHAESLNLNPESLNLNPESLNLNPESLKPKKEKKSPTSIEVDFYDVPKELIADFERIRKAKRAPITQTAIDKIKKEAEEIKLTLSDALTFCCMRGWAGFNKDWILKDKDNHRPSPTKNSFDNSNLAAFGFHGKATALAAEELQKRYDLADVGAI